MMMMMMIIITTIIISVARGRGPSSERKITIEDGRIVFFVLADPNNEQTLIFDLRNWKKEKVFYPSPSQPASSDGRACERVFVTTKQAEESV